MSLKCECCNNDDPKFYGPMINHSLWREVSDFHHQYLCSCCVEKRLERKLEKEDLLPCPLSDIWWIEHRDPNHKFGTLE